MGIFPVLVLKNKPMSAGRSGGMIRSVVPIETRMGNLALEVG